MLVPVTDPNTAPPDPPPATSPREQGPYVASMTAELRPGPGAVRLARCIVSQRLAAWGAPAAGETAALLMSELVTNAMVHAPGPVRLRLYLRGGLVRGEVVDRHPDRRPRLCEATSADESGRGLLVVDALARRWGSTPTAGGKSVWFELPLAAAAG